MKDAVYVREVSVFASNLKGGGEIQLASGNELFPLTISAQDIDTFLNVAQKVLAAGRPDLSFVDVEVEQVPEDPVAVDLAAKTK